VEDARFQAASSFLPAGSLVAAVCSRLQPSAVESQELATIILAHPAPSVFFCCNFFRLPRNRGLLSPRIP
jgi:hypothetical protein